MPVTPPPASGGGGGGSVVFYDEGSAIGTGTVLNFVGAGVTGTFSGGTAVATIAGGTAAGSIVVREEGTAVGTATDLNFVGSSITATFSGGTATITDSGGGAADDPVQDVFGTADTAFEFDTSSLTGLTAMQTPDSEDADTTVPGHLYLKDNASGVSRCGRYKNGLSTPFTVITKISDANTRNDYNQVGLFVGESTPGAMRTIQWGSASRRVETESQTPTSFVGSITSALSDLQTPLYFGIVVNSGTDIDFLYSYGGRIWTYLTEAHNSGLTIAAAGVVIAANSASGVAAAFDYLRIWNSAKTFPGVY